MHRHHRTALLPIALVLVALVWGCGSSDDPTDPPVVDNGPDWPEDLGGLPEADEVVFAEVQDRLVDLRGEHGIAAARDSLLTDLQAGWPGVAAARLCADATSIDIEFDGGAGTTIFTDETAFGALTKSGAPPSGSGVASGSSREMVCEGVILPPSRKVHIVNMAGASDPESLEYPTMLKSYLLNLGWGADEVDITQCESLDDYSFTPETLFHHQGYGVVLFIGHGGFRVDEHGQERFIIQAFRGGAYELFQDYVTPERWAEYRQWRDDGQLTRGTTWCHADSTYQSHVFIREDRLAAEMDLEEGALVSFICCNSIQLDEELTALGAGSVLAWDGSMNGPDGCNSWAALFHGLTGAVDPTSAAATLDWMHANDLGYSTGHSGEQTIMRLGGPEGDFYLPAQVTFVAGETCLPTGADHLDVDVLYPDCADENRSFSFAAAGSSVQDGLAPIEAEVSFKVKDAGGVTLAGGRYDLHLHGGFDTEELCPCTGELDLDLGDLPVDGDFTATDVDLTLSWDDETVEPVEVSHALPVDTLADLLPGTVSVAAALRNTAGDTLGTATLDDVDLACETTEAELCFGWLEISLTDYPADTDHVVVTCAEGLPAEIDMAPDETAGLYGFAVDQGVMLSAEAFNSVGTSLGTASATFTVDCGPTAAELSFNVYGIILTAAPHRVEPDGTSTATVTACLKTWLPDDEFEPTGGPVAGKLVEFDTTVGFFTGATSAVTGADGCVTVEVASNDVGVADVHAYVMADLIESRPAQVNFGQRMSWYLSGSSTPPDEGGVGDMETFTIHCAHAALVVNGVTWNESDFGPHGYWSFYVPAHAGEGNVIELVVTAHPEFEQCETTDPFLGEVWLHTLYEPDLIHQRAYQMSTATTLTGTITLSVTVEEIDYYSGAKSGLRDFAAPPADTPRGYERCSDEGGNVVRFR